MAASNSPVTCADLDMSVNCLRSVGSTPPAPILPVATVNRPITGPAAEWAGGFGVFRDAETYNGAHYYVQLHDVDTKEEPRKIYKRQNDQRSHFTSSQGTFF